MPGLCGITMTWVIQQIQQMPNGTIAVFYWNGPRDSGVVSWSSSIEDLPNAAKYRSKVRAEDAFGKRKSGTKAVRI